jgi:16S rRNA (adenine1518-N6/adenine1519-N6)-dimethyltransferase
VTTPPIPGDLPPLRDIIARYGLSARRSLGQNFLLDENLLDRIARAAGPLEGRHVVEIGPGPGGLTRALLRTGAARVTAIEKDRRAVDALNDLALSAGGRLSIVEDDALNVDFTTLVDEPAPIVGNLPFNIATPLLFRLLDQTRAVSAMTLMFQREVAQRLTAQPNSKAYGRLAVTVQWRCIVKRCFDVPARAFVPAPKVAATVVHLAMRPQPQFPAAAEPLMRVVQAAFGQRRKALRNALQTLPVNADDLLAAAGIEPGLRAESLDIESFCAQANAYASFTAAMPGESA